MGLLNEIDNLDGIAQANLLKNKAIKPEEVIQHYIKKITQLNPRLNAVVLQMFDEALETVQQQNYNEGPFSGMPFLIKDLNAIKDHPITFGSKLMEGYIAPQDDDIVTRYRKAGFVFLGKTSTPELGLLPATEPDYLKPTQNPWDTCLSAGGSSGGSAVAVATGMIPFAHASDGGGSIRIPASCCGVFGLKPTRGRTPLPVSMSGFSTHHAITRSVRDSAALLDVLDGPSLGDGYASPRKNKPFLSEVENGPKRLRIAVSFDWNGSAHLDPEVKKALQHTIKLCMELGHEVEEVKLDINRERMENAFMISWLVSSAVGVKQLGSLVGKEPTTAQLEPLTYFYAQKGEQISATEYETAGRTLINETKQAARLFQTYDVLLTPVLTMPPLPLGSFNDNTKPLEERMNLANKYCPYTPIANITGQPAMSVPLYWTENGVPIGSQFFGRFGDEATLVKLAAQLEKAQPWQPQYKKLKTMLDEL